MCTFLFSLQPLYCSCITPIFLQFSEWKNIQQSQKKEYYYPLLFIKGFQIPTFTKKATPGLYQKIHWTFPVCTQLSLQTSGAASLAFPFEK